jgi:SAM-dependent methyltransferase
MDYYHLHAREYHDRTFAVDPSPFLSPLLPFLQARASVLDVGCALGRDMLWLSGKGFDLTGFERSPGLASLAREQTGLPVIEGDFETFDFSALSFDAVLLVGALVHVVPYELPLVLSRIQEALRPGGHLLWSMKQGRGTEIGSEGRLFYLWQEEGVRHVLDLLGCECMLVTSQQSIIAPGTTWLTCVARKEGGQGA